MALAYVIKARAQREIERAAQWWAVNQPAAPGAVRRDIELAFAVLVEQPEVGRKIDTRRPVQVRRYALGRTKYHLYYRVRGMRLEILSLWHSRRERGPVL